MTEPLGEGHVLNDALRSAQELISEHNDNLESAEYPKQSEADRNIALEKELSQLNRINDTLDSVLESIIVTNANIERIITSSEQSNKLIETWAKILSQNKHTFELLEDDSWQGASRDIDTWNSKLMELTDLQKKQKEIQEKLGREKDQELKQEQLAQAKKRERQEMLQRRVYGRRSTIRKQ
ncbi:BA75_01883T0 [Komagataella pastoris]|uniref:DASH complex subunit DUO1 n=1 Tax=Komagataella pastoris TaxID=4922 RepID=A0A1B2JBH4_PICPA|nr:BA75_01883T0 [Komagataella pastoris]